MDILVTFLFSVNALSLSPECRIPEAGFTCAARPALALVVAGEEKGESVYGHTLLFTKTLLVGQPVGFPAGRPTCPRAKGEEEREGCRGCQREQWIRGWWDRLDSLLRSRVQHHRSEWGH
jgi:hypothetical protein